MKCRLFALLCLQVSACGHGPGALPTGPGVFVLPSGAWTVNFKTPAWSFAGQLPGAASSIATAAGMDAIGTYQETSFSYSGTTPKSAAIRIYDKAPIVIFREKHLADTQNEVLAGGGAPFPTFTKFPQGLHYLNYVTDQFSPFSFSSFSSDSPWFYFDDQANAFVISAAQHFMNAGMYHATDSADSTIECGVDSDVPTLPSGYEQQYILVASPGINQTFQTWGNALLALSGKSRPANDATVDLNTLGYWTDNGAAYYYKFDQTKGYTNTLLAVKTDFNSKGINFGYMQVDSWWYPKGMNNTWSDRAGGEYSLTADAMLFPTGLGAFQQALGLPLVTHARWIDPASPYRTKYTISKNVSTDPKFWDDVSTYLKNNGVITYEQDWLNDLALPLTTNLNDQDAFTDNMASHMKAQGVSMQYCMPLPRHFLQSTKYPNLLTTRVTPDRFNNNGTPSRWLQFLYGARLASALGEWPWTDVIFSTEEGNLILATLSGGMVGVGDAIGSESATTLSRAVRADGVIVKPDGAIVPLDSTIVRGAKGASDPVIAATFSDNGSGLSAAYVFAYAAGSNTLASFSPNELGYSGDVYVFNFLTGSGKVTLGGQSYSENTVNGFSYYVVSPIGPSKMAFLGDAGKYASLGKKRISSWSDNGTITATVSFATGETAVTLHGYAPAAPNVNATAGSVGAVQYDAGTQTFSVPVMPAGNTATITISQ